ncbi:hypothetical protein SAMN02910406_00508 [Ruminococcus albus]|uniref:Uncharacterized protein n=1 Tax=Ruminococcus albus TaxID=1264 RepID=A0A1I1DSE5_RUMAL|nr:hypothetical protein SAMN02910406_00508 [Ruminococcus albus]
MIKGVNKQIIEIKCTNSEYFERALLFVNSNCELFSENDPHIVAGEYLQKLTDEMEGVERDEKNFHDKTLRSLLTVLFGAIVTSVLVVVLIAL